MDQARQIQTNLLLSRASDSSRHGSGDLPINPWLPHLTPDANPAAPPVRPSPAIPEAAALSPQPGVAAPDVSEQLPRRLLTREELLVPVWWVGAHGGAGESTLAEFFATTRAAGHAWPISSDPARLARTFLVARTSYRGLIAAQTALRDWASGSVAADLDGLVLIADAPGRLPRELRALQSLVTAAGPGNTWHLGWSIDWRLGRIFAERPDRELQNLTDHLNTKE